MDEDPVVADLDKVDQLIMLTLGNRPFDQI